MLRISLRKMINAPKRKKISKRFGVFQWRYVGHHSQFPSQLLTIVHFFSSRRHARARRVAVEMLRTGEGENNPTPVRISKERMNAIESHNSDQIKHTRRIVHTSNEATSSKHQKKASKQHRMYQLKEVWVFLKMNSRFIFRRRFAELAKLEP